MPQDTENEEIQAPQTKISFEDYEAFMQRLEQDGRMDVLESQNPKSRKYMLDKEWSKRQEDFMKDNTRNY